MQRMKKMFSTMMLFAAAAMAFVSCQKNEIAPEYEQTILTFTSSNPETKTEWNGETIVWSDKDDIRVALMIGEIWYQDNSGAKLYQSNTISGSSETASFSVSKFEQTTIQNAGWTGDYQYYALYPSSAEDSNFGKSTSMASITIPSEQELSSVSFDKSADILWGKAVNVYTSLTTTEIPLIWTRVVAHAYITLNDIKDITEGELVKKVTLTAQNGAAITGACELHMSTGEFTAKSSASNVITLTSDQGIAVSGGDISFWACINPCTVTSLDIVVDTDAATYTISKTGFEREFLQNKRNTLPINMAEADRVPKETGEEGGDVDAKYYVKVTEAPEDWSGTYLLVCEEENIAMTGSATSNTDIKKPTSVEITQNGIQYNSAMENISVSINSVDSGYLIVTRSGYGVYCTDSNTTFAASKTSSTYSKYPYTISLSYGKFVIMRGGKYMMYNKSSDVFGFYTSETQTAIQLYRLQD